MSLSPILAVALVATPLAQSTAPRYQPPSRDLIAWTIGDVTCGGTPVGMTRRVEPFIAQTYFSPSAKPTPRTVTFTIDASGRAMDISDPREGYAPETGDIGPSLAASAFAPGAPHKDCRAIYLPRRMALDSAPLADVRRFAITPNVRPDREVFRRTFPADTDCFEPGPGVTLRGFPPYRDLPPNPGVIAWSMTGFDIDSTGRPVHLQTVDGTGDAALDRASRKAVADSRFEAKPRHGCVYPYYQNAAVLPEPTSPDTASLRSAGSNCPAEREWERTPHLVFPAAWNRRKIEGWAILAYDVAPWGATGNIRVLAAEPSAEFGTDATNVIRAATKPKSSSGYTDCVERVRYRIALPGEPVAADAAPPPF